ncbi:hypothetical protein GCM10027452_06610 [Micromonospora halotolerans]
MDRPAAPTRRITIIDVARHAQVSTTAVSKVLRNAYGVSPTMQAKVRQAISELGYRPNAAARAMRGQTYTIGIMLPDIRNPFFADILDGLTARIAGTDYQVLLGPGCNGEEAEARVIHAMIDRGMDGMVLVAPISTRAYLEQVAGVVPTVVVGRHGRSQTYDTVADDDLTGAALVVNHLADLGHRRIAHIEHHETTADSTRSTSRPPDTTRRAATSAPASYSPGRSGPPPSSPAPTSPPWARSTPSPRPGSACPTTSPSPATTTPRSPRSGRSP